MCRGFFWPPHQSPLSHGSSFRTPTLPCSTVLHPSPALPPTAERYCTRPALPCRSTVLPPTFACCPAVALQYRTARHRCPVWCGWPGPCAVPYCTPSHLPYAVPYCTAGLPGPVCSSLFRCSTVLRPSLRAPSMPCPALLQYRTAPSPTLSSPAPPPTAVRYCTRPALPCHAAVPYCSHRASWLAKTKKKRPERRLWSEGGVIPRAIAR